MNKFIAWRKSGLAFLAIASMTNLAAGILGSEIGITDNSFVLIPDGTLSTSLRAGTNFGNVAVTGGLKAKSFRIHNRSDNQDLTLTDAVTITGTNAADFTITVAPSVLIGHTEGANTPMEIAFHPSGAGARTATVTVKSSDTDNPTYTFAIAGTGGWFPLAGPDLDVTLVEPKAKIQTKTDITKIKGKAYLSNLGPVEMTSGKLQFYYSRDIILDPSDPLLVEVILAPLAPFNPDKPKIKKVKYKAEELDGINGGNLFVRALPLLLDVEDNDWSNNNVSQIHYLVSNPVGP